MFFEKALATKKISNMNIMLLAQHLPQVTAAATESRESLHQWLGPRNNYEKKGSGPGNMQEEEAQSVVA